MRAEMYEIFGHKGNAAFGTEESFIHFAIRANGHVQHHPGSTRLLGLSASGQRRIDAARKDGYCVRVTVGGRSVGVEN